MFLSGSTNRWDILKKNLSAKKALAPKELCITRWSSRIDAMRPLRHNLAEIIATLREIENSDNFQANVRHQAASIASKINFLFVCCVCVWSDILNQTNIVSKGLQSIQSNIQMAVKSIESLKDFLQNYNEYGCNKIHEEAVNICESIGIEPDFNDQRRSTANRSIISYRVDFQTKVFQPILQAITESIVERFESLEEYDKFFSFLYDYENFEEKKRNGSLLKSCKEL